MEIDIEPGRKKAQDESLAWPSGSGHILTHT